MDKQNVMNSYNKIIFSHKMDGKSCTYNMDKLQEHHSKLSKPITIRQILYNSIYMKHAIKFIEAESRMVIVRS